LYVVAHQEAAQAIGALTNVVFQRLQLLRARHGLRRVSKLLQLVEDVSLQ
jgi:hypothetical protein